MKLPDYLKNSMIDLQNCTTVAADDLYVEHFFLMLEKAEKEKEINEETKKILIEKYCSNFENLEF